VTPLPSPAIKENLGIKEIVGIKENLGITVVTRA
jgi:hypothetical protein